MGADKAGVAWLLAVRLAAGQVKDSMTVFRQPRDDSYGSQVPEECVVRCFLYWAVVGWAIGTGCGCTW